ncbi:VOC family protein, partial [Actinoplanes utahensis]
TNRSAPETGTPQTAGPAGAAQSTEAQTRGAGDDDTATRPEAPTAGGPQTDPRAAARPSQDENPWAPPTATGRAAASAPIPPNVDARPLGSRTRFFMQPGDDADASSTTAGPDAPPSPAPTARSEEATPSARERTDEAAPPSRAHSEQAGPPAGTVSSAWSDGIAPPAKPIPRPAADRPAATPYREPGEDRSQTGPEENRTPPVARPVRPEPAATAHPAQPRPERAPSSTPHSPSPVSSSPHTPSPLSPPPAAPAPDRLFPSAPRPTIAHDDGSLPGIDQIDIPLDPDFPIGADLPIYENPEPAPENRPHASGARSDGIIAPPQPEPPEPDRAHPATGPQPSSPQGRAGSAEAPQSSQRDRTSSGLETGRSSAAAGSAAGQAPVGGTGTRPAPRRDGAEPAGEDGMPTPSALRDGIIGVAVGRAAVSPDAFPTPRFDDAETGDRPDDETDGETRDRTDAETGGETGDGKQQGSPWGDFSGRRQPDERAGDVITAYPSARPGPAGAIHGVGITILVTDLERSMRFYRDTLGFFEIDNGDGSAVLASGDTRLVLRTVHNLTSDAGRLIYLNLEVGDIEAVHAELRDKGVKFVHSPRAVNRGDKLELWSATFRDPDNHNIAITQWRAIG